MTAFAGRIGNARDRRLRNPLITLIQATSPVLRTCSWLESLRASRRLRNASLSLTYVRDLLSQPRMSIAL